jgi:hypothetical protein
VQLGSLTEEGKARGTHSTDRSTQGDEAAAALQGSI